MRRSGVSGQSLAEVAVIIAIVVSVASSMMLYVQRSFQAKYKAGADFLLKNITAAAPAYAGLPQHYEPYYSESVRESNNTFNTLSGYPDNSVNDTNREVMWFKTDIPWQID